MAQQRMAMVSSSLTVRHGHKICPPHGVVKAPDTRTFILVGNNLAQVRIHIIRNLDVRRLQIGGQLLYAVSAEAVVDVGHNIFIGGGLSYQVQQQKIDNS